MLFAERPTLRGKTRSDKSWMWGKQKYILQIIPFQVLEKTGLEYWCEKSTSRDMTHWIFHQGALILITEGERQGEKRDPSAESKMRRKRQ